MSPATKIFHKVDTFQHRAAPKTKNIRISNFNKLNLDDNNYLFHAGTKKENDEILAIGGRVLNFISLSNNLISARKSVIENLNKLNWDKGFFRKDIAFKVIDK